MCKDYQIIKWQLERDYCFTSPIVKRTEPELHHRYSTVAYFQQVVGLGLPASSSVHPGLATMRPAWLLLYTSLLLLDEIPGLQWGGVTTPSPPPCCARKNVGGIFYSFLARDPKALSLGCLSDCTYTSDMFPYTAVCFRKGPLGNMCLPARQPPTTIDTITPTTVDPSTTKATTKATTIIGDAYS